MHGPRGHGTGATWNSSSMFRLGQESDRLGLMFTARLPLAPQCPTTLHTAGAQASTSMMQIELEIASQGHASGATEARAAVSFAN